MDAERFDALARTLDSASRRRFAQSLAGFSFGALVPLLSLTESEAGRKGKGKKGKGKKKKKGAKCEGNNCKNPPEGFKDCLYGGHHAGCTGNAGGPCCHVGADGFGECRVCTPDCNCAAPKFCSVGENENVCMSV